jgi:hypothetical protein
MTVSVPSTADQMRWRTITIFLERFMSTAGDDAFLLRSDLGRDTWGSVTNDPGLWFEWVQAYWEARGVAFPGPILNHSNPVGTPSGARILEVPDSGEDPYWASETNRSGTEREDLDQLTVFLDAWSGSLAELVRHAKSHAGS